MSVFWLRGVVGCGWVVVVVVVVVIVVLCLSSCLFCSRYRGLSSALAICCLVSVVGVVVGVWWYGCLYVCVRMRVYVCKPVYVFPRKRSRLTSYRPTSSHTSSQVSCRPTRRPSGMKTTRSLRPTSAGLLATTIVATDRCTKALLSVTIQETIGSPPKSLQMARPAASMDSCTTKSGCQ